MSGVVGSHLLAHLLTTAWLERDGQTRAIRVTDAGRRGLRRHFGAAVLD
jgi:hypothetical protein